MGTRGQSKGIHPWGDKMEKMKELVEEMAKISMASSSAPPKIMSSGSKLMADAQKTM
jgi:hypothetical protein